MISYISGIQQVGIGVKNAQKAKYHYRDLFGMDVLVFEDRAEASLMTKYTGNEKHSREAILTMNMQGGGGFEIWQFTSREPAFSKHNRQYGDIGIYAVKMRCRVLDKTNFNGQQRSGVVASPSQQRMVWVHDADDNAYQVVEHENIFKPTKHNNGGVLGAIIGVSDIKQSMHFYREVLGVHEIVHDITGPFTDVPSTAQGHVFRRVLLRKPFTANGAFSKLLGDIEIELVQALDREPNVIYENRYWGDCGFIHLCFDVPDMDKLKVHAHKNGYEFKVDSADSFCMGTSAGRFGYMEDPDGTLIEVVETHKVPILKKLNWYFDLKKRKHNRPLPDWMIGMLALSKVK